jgi:hypothetical protein
MPRLPSKGGLNRWGVRRQRAAGQARLHYRHRLNNYDSIPGARVCWERTAEKREAPSKETAMGRNLDLENCKNKQEAVIAAYVEELEENERRICDEGAWAISLDLSRIKFWLPILMKYCPNHPHTDNLKRERELYRKRKGLDDFIF